MRAWRGRQAGRGRARVGSLGCALPLVTPVGARSVAAGLRLQPQPGQSTQNRGGSAQQEAGVAAPACGAFSLPHMDRRGSGQGEEEPAAMVWDAQLWDGMASVGTEGQKPKFSFMKQLLLNTGNDLA